MHFQTVAYGGGSPALKQIADALGGEHKVTVNA